MKQIAKKSLALLLAVCFMLTTAIVALPLSVSAAEATKCATWADVVAAVEADSAASIKLTNHVTANSTIASFAGTFDGNGYTVTVEKTMFTALADGAVLKNFQTTAPAAISVAPIASTANGGTVTFQNVVNNVDVSTTGQLGGFISTTTGTLTINMTSCVNNGDIESTDNQVSGIVGNADGNLTVNFTDVVNNGAVTGGKNYAAGIICANGTIAGTITRAINNGAITVSNTKDGSNLAGIIGTCSKTCTASLVECVNTGTLTLDSSKSGTKYGPAGMVSRTKTDDSAVTMDGCVSTGLLVAPSGCSADAFFVPEKGSATATNCIYANTLSTTIASGATASADASAAIAAIKAKMTLPTFDANKAPETDAPAGDTPDLSERFSFSVDAGFGTATVEGPKYMTVGTTDAITVTFSSTEGMTAMAAGFNSENTNVVDFPGEVTFESELAFTDSTDESYAKRGCAGFSTSGDPVHSAVITIPVSAIAVGTSAITLIVDGTYDLFFCDPLGEKEYVHNVADIGYTITVVDESSETPEGGDTPDLTERFSFSVDAGFGTATVEGPKYMTVGTTDAITVTFSSTEGMTAMAAGFNSENTNVVDFPGEVTFESELAFTDSTDESYAKRGCAGFSTSGDPVHSAVITIPVSAIAVGTSAITLIVDGTYDLFFCDPLGEKEYVHNVADIGYTITVVEENDTPDEPVVEENSTKLDATTGSLTVSGPATAVAGESFDVTFTWSDYGFTPDAIDLNFFLNTITSKTQAGNIAVSAIKSTNLTSYATSFVGITDVENLYKIALTDMVVAEDTVEIVVTFTATTPGFTGFSLQYAALSNVGTGYTEINHIEGDPAEAYVVEITVPETSHTVIFKDGDTTLETATGVAYGAILTDVYTAPVKEGYTFKGWTDADGNAVTTVTGDITVYADYAVNEYTVNITVNNGSATNATQKLNYAGSIDATVNAALAAAGLKPATGYKDSYTVSTPSVAGTTINVTVTYSTKLTYTVKFVGYNGANLGSVTVEHGAAATAPSAPAVEGYTFTGWDKDFSKVTGALTVTAKYEINKYTVNFVGFDGADLGSVTVNHGDAAAAPTAPAVTGYTFKGWDKAFDKVTGNLTVTAVYEINKYTVTFKGQDGATLKTETVEHGKAATAPTAPAVTGYTFKNWDKDFSKVTGALTVTAVYTINSYNVTVTVKSEGDFAKTTANYGTSYTLPSADDIADLLTTDDIFTGWSINGKTYAAGAKVTITADTVITAILSNVQYFNVTIKDVTETIKAYAEGTTFTVPAAAGKTGYTFINWTDASGKVYTAGQTVTVTADITLTANYKINKYTVNFIGKDGSIIKSETVEYGKGATAPSAPAVTGYTFSKWDKDFSNVTSNLEVKAVYTINSYDIVITDHNGTVKTVKANYGVNVLEVVNANYTKDASLVFVGFYNSNGTLISSTGKVTAKTLVYVAYTVEDIFAAEGKTNTLWNEADGTITFYAGAKANLYTYGTVAKNGGTGDTITFTAPLLVDDAVASKISYPAETATYTIIVMGDVDGDADVDLTDAELAAACIGNSKALSGNYYTAANTTAPAALITARDIAAIKAFARGNIDYFTNPYVL